MRVYATNCHLLVIIIEGNAIYCNFSHYVTAKLVIALKRSKRSLVWATWISLGSGRSQQTKQPFDAVIQTSARVRSHANQIHRWGLDGEFGCHRQVSMPLWESNCWESTAILKMPLLFYVILIECIYQIWKQQQQMHHKLFNDSCNFYLHVSCKCRVHRLSDSWSWNYTYSIRRIGHVIFVFST